MLQATVPLFHGRPRLSRIPSLQLRVSVLRGLDPDPADLHGRETSPCVPNKFTKQPRLLRRLGLGQAQKPVVPLSRFLAAAVWKPRHDAAVGSMTSLEAGSVSAARLLV